MGSNIENATPAHCLAVQTSLYGLNEYFRGIRFNDVACVRPLLIVSQIGVVQCYQTAATVHLKMPIIAVFDLYLDIRNQPFDLDTCSVPVDIKLYRGGHMFYARPSTGVT
ncbi:hypothetical protein LJR231_004209 [Phyllobacterium sp. LjRoot231]|uniref:hypothetical protein n=1 Tax=Phyllobacterium sp. LjRoot231 TaxID=3342289 RepID=UPI003ECD2B4E